MKPKLLQFDNVDDRSEILRLFDFIHPRERWRFLKWCAKRCRSVQGKSVGVAMTPRELDLYRDAVRIGGKHDTAFKIHCYHHVWNLHTAWQLDLTEAVAKLTAMARGKETGAAVLKDGIGC